MGKPHNAHGKEHTTEKCAFGKNRKSSTTNANCTKNATKTESAENLEKYVDGNRIVEDTNYDFFKIL